MENYWLYYWCSKYIEGVVFWHLWSFSTGIL